MRPARTKSLRCGNDLGNARVVTDNACETVDKRTCTPGHGQFMSALRFESGKLVAISYGDRVN